MSASRHSVNPWLILAEAQERQMNIRWDQFQMSPFRWKRPNGTHLPANVQTTSLRSGTISRAHLWSLPPTLWVSAVTAPGPALVRGSPCRASAPATVAPPIMRPLGPPRAEDGRQLPGESSCLPGSTYVYVYLCLFPRLLVLNPPIMFLPDSSPNCSPLNYLRPPLPPHRMNKRGHCSQPCPKSLRALLSGSVVWYSPFSIPDRGPTLYSQCHTDPPPHEAMIWAGVRWGEHQRYVP